MNTTEIIQFLKQKVNLFKDFSDDALTNLVEGSQITTFEGNEAVIEYGEEGLFLGVLIEGEAKASITDNTGKIFRVGTFKPGDFFGEISLMTGDKTIADVIGVTRCKALLIPQMLFSSMLVTNPKAVQMLTRSLSERIKKWAFDEKTGKNLSEFTMRRKDDPYGFKLRTEKPTKILVINCGSSSLKFNLFDTGDERNNVRGIIEKIGTQEMNLASRTAKGAVSRTLSRGGHAEAFDAMVEHLCSSEMNTQVAPRDISLVGHRVAHGGDLFISPTVITPEVLSQIESLSDLAPLHNPVNIVGIRQAQRIFPYAEQVAVFDTAFHHTMPPFAYLYGLPYEYYKQKKIRRYGFHGMSHLYVSMKAAEYLKRSLGELELISCHLGNGASICAIDHGRSVDTSMGFTPAEGLLMGTRCGNLDPAVLIYLMQKEGLGAQELNDLINKQSGLLGLSGISNDMREIERAADQGNHRALLAYKTFCYNIRKYIGAYVAVMHGLDALIFTGGIGQGSAGVRSLACQRLGYMGIEIDEKRNRRADPGGDVFDIATDDSKVRVLVIPTDEELMIARQSLRAQSSTAITRIIDTQKERPIPIEASAHHVHLSKKHAEALFGPGYDLTPVSELSQPGQFACKETVTLAGPKGRVERVRVLGPVRSQTQVEISMTEQFRLGIYPPIRESGDLADTPGITIEGEKGSVTIEKGVICALRHIHMSPEDALSFGLRDKYKVRVRVQSDREVVFGDVLVRVHPNFKLAMHLDTDEANAGNIKTGAVGYIEGVQS